MYSGADIRVREVGVGFQQHQGYLSVGGKVAFAPAPVFFQPDAFTEIGEWKRLMEFAQLAGVETFPVTFKNVKFRET